MHPNAGMEHAACTWDRAAAFARRHGRKSGSYGLSNLEQGLPFPADLGQRVTFDFLRLKKMAMYRSARKSPNQNSVLGGACAGHTLRWSVVQERRTQSGGACRQILPPRTLHLASILLLMLLLLLQEANRCNYSSMKD